VTRATLAAGGRDECCKRILNLACAEWFSKNLIEVFRF
jgi:hypothetical protein